MPVKQPGSGSGLLWILAARQLLLPLLDPSLDQLADTDIGALVTGLSGLSISALIFLSLPVKARPAPMLDT
jgi:hypothetical protein